MIFSGGWIVPVSFSFFFMSLVCVFASVFASVFALSKAERGGETEGDLVWIVIAVLLLPTERALTAVNENVLLDHCNCDCDCDCTSTSTNNNGSTSDTEGWEKERCCEFGLVVSRRWLFILLLLFLLFLLLLLLLVVVVVASVFIVDIRMIECYEWMNEWMLLYWWTT